MRQTLAALLVAAVAMAGCGSSTSTATSSGLPATPPALAGSSTVAGLWRGSLPGSAQEVQLFLTQSGRQLRGDGAILTSGDPLPLQVGGSQGTQGFVQLTLSTVDKSEAPYVQGLDATFEGDGAQAALLGNQSAQSFQLARASLVSLNLPSSFQVSSAQAGLQLQIALDTAGSSEYTGTWSVAGNSLACIQSFTQGRASYSPLQGSPWARLALEDPSGVLELGTLWVQAGSSTTDPDSTALTAQGLVHFGP